MLHNLARLKVYPFLCYFPEKKDYASTIGNVHPGKCAAVLDPDPTPIYFWRGKDMEICASGLFPNLLTEYRSPRSNMVVISSEKLLSEKRQIGALRNECTVVTCSHPPSPFKDTFCMVVAKRWQLCPSPGPQIAEQQWEREAVIAHSTGVNVCSQPQIKQAGRKKKAQSRQ